MHHALKHMEKSEVFIKICTNNTMQFLKILRGKPANFDNFGQ